MISAISSMMNSFTTPISVCVKTCSKHKVEYEEKIYKHFTRGCPECLEERTKEKQRIEQEKQKKRMEDLQKEIIVKRIGISKIPKRFQEKIISSYRVENKEQKFIISRVSAYAREFSQDKNSKRNMAFLGNAGTGKTHLACAIARHVIKNCNRLARFTCVSEINRLIRESKSFSSDFTETEVIQSFGSYDILIIDEVGVQSGTDAESRALFDIFNERYQQEMPTILISNLNPQGFRDAVGERITDRIKDDAGEVLLFNWESGRG